MRQASSLVTALLLGLAATTGCGEGTPDEPAEPAAPPTPFDGATADTLFQLGAASGQPWESFEGLWDIEVDAQGRLAILDLGGPAIHIFDASGAHLASIDEVGTGAGQLDGPTGISWGAPGELAVWDPGSSWISRFRVGAAGVEIIDRKAASAFGETGFCAASDRAYLSYLEGGVVVHEVGADGIERSFGDAPMVVGADALGPELRGIALEEMTPSALLCTGAGVVDVSLAESAVRLHDPDGNPVWSVQLADFRPISVYSDDGIGLGRRFDAGEGSHLFRSVVPWGDSLLLVQHELRRQEIPMEGAAEVIESRLLSLADGSEVARSRDFPAVMAAGAGRIYLVRWDPFPVVTAVTGG